MALLMTPTLWDSVDWLQKCPPSWKKRAYQGLLDMLNRKWAPTPAIERGIAFEKQICYGTNPIEKVASDLKEKFTVAYDLIHAEGRSFQSKCKKFYKYDEKEFIVYGKEDVHFDSLIIDIKTTGNYRGESSYLSKWQHRVYTTLTRIPDFKYIVYEFDNKSGLLVDVHTIDYHNDDFSKTNKQIEDNIAKVVKFIRADPVLKKAYLNKFNMYN